MTRYRLELGHGEADERLELTAEDDNAARREALLTMGDVLRDQAFGGSYTTRLDLSLFREDGGVVYKVHVAAA